MLLVFVFPVFCGQALYVSVFCWGSVGNAACRGVIWSFVVHCIVTNICFGFVELVTPPPRCCLFLLFASSVISTRFVTVARCLLCFSRLFIVSRVSAIERRMHPFVLRRETRYSCETGGCLSKQLLRLLRVG